MFTIIWFLMWVASNSPNIINMVPAGGNDVSWLIALGVGVFIDLVIRPI
jgi:hypothetical protein